MTRYIISSIFILALFVIAPKQVNAGTHGSVNTEMNDQKAPLKSIPGALPEAPAEKGHGHPPGMDETPHIHHFHKQRVKKLKKHHHYWTASKALLVLIHAVLLFMSYMHVVH